MLSTWINTRPIKTTLIFPSDQKLWAFFARAEVSDFRIESSKNTITARLQRDDIELARNRFGAVELKEEAIPFNFGRYLFNNVLWLGQFCSMKGYLVWRA
jgi:hypothetical protein